jgi:hypothetical protein
MASSRPLGAAILYRSLGSSSGPARPCYGISGQSRRRIASRCSFRVTSTMRTGQRALICGASWAATDSKRVRLHWSRNSKKHSTASTTTSKRHCALRRGASSRTSCGRRAVVCTQVAGSYTIIWRPRCDSQYHRVFSAIPVGIKTAVRLPGMKAR